MYPGTPLKRTEGDDPRVQRSALNLPENGEPLQYFSQKMSLGGNPNNMFAWNSDARATETSSKRQSTLKAGEIKWSDQEIKQSRQFAVKHINLEQNAYEDNQENWKLVGKNDSQ